jgi:hypothetical protein
MRTQRNVWITSAVLTAPAVGWLSLLHRIAGHSPGSLLADPLVLARDSALAFPLVAAAVYVALAAERRWRAQIGLEGAAAYLVRTAMLALLAAGALGAGNAPHQTLFGSDGGERGQSLLTAVLSDALVSLPLLVVLAALLGLNRIPLPPVRRRRTLLVLSTTALTVLAGPGTAALAANGGTGGGGTGGDAGGSTIVVPTATDPGNPCPAGAPQKRFDIEALNVKIPINRYGDNDPQGRMYALTSMESAIRAEEASQQVSIGLRDDPIQPLVLRANLGDCVTFTYRNNATGGSFGVHIDGLSFTSGSSGDSVGKNLSSEPATGGSASYVYYVPNDPSLEGAHYIHPGPGSRTAVNHGLFGALAVEPAGSTYRNPSTGNDQPSGWEADILPAGNKAFREGVKLLHEIGNDNEQISDKNGNLIDVQDSVTGSYKPGSFALNYRSEPFKNRLIGHPTEKSHSYGSYTFGDPATPMPRGYVGDPTKFRIVHASGEKFHVYHLHGGGDRWRMNPHADTTYDYADTGLRKDPPTVESPSQRLDSQSMGPGESYDLEIEGGAGGVQQSVGDFLYHCHIAKHYTSGMWSFWRVFNTQQPDLLALPDRDAPPTAVDSTNLIGKTMPDGTTLTSANLASWIRPQLPPQGVPKTGQDAAVWNYTVDSSGLFLGEPEDLTVAPDSVSRYLDPAHPNRLPGDQMVGDRPKLLFDPTTGRPAYPLMRTHVGKRPPFTPNGHSGAPYLGENAGATKTAAVNPWAARTDGLCPTGRPLRTFNVVAIETPVPESKTTVDPDGKLFVLAKNKDKVKTGAMPAEPLAIRSNQGDCDAITLTNEMTDAKAFDGWSKTSMHIHHVQFDVQGSDGVTAGFAFEHSVRPYKVEDPQLTAAATTGDTSLTVSSTAKFQVGEFIAAGEGTDGIDIGQIAAINGNVLTMAAPLAHDHAVGEWAGTEFIQYRWYPDVVLDNIFWHDHVDGIHGWGHGLVGQLIVEPAGSTYHDPKTGAEVDSGTLVDVHTSNPLAPGVVNGSFRELALWTINDNDQNSKSTLNLRAEPLAGRDPATRFSSYVNGDPVTPLPQAYPGDKIVIRSINVSPTLDTLHVQGSRFLTENRYVDASGPEASLIDTIHHGMSERTTLMLDAGGARHVAGDTLYFSGSDTRMNQGAWGLIRVLPGSSGGLKPLPDNAAPADAWSPPTLTTPPPTTDPGSPCPTGAPVHSFAVSAVDVSGGHPSVAYVRTADLAAVKAGTRKVEPLVLHVAAGQCVQVDFRNDRTPDALVPTIPKASFSVAKLDQDPGSSGVDAGYSSEQTVSPGQSRRYVYFVDSAKLGSATIADFGSDSAKSGLYGAVVVAAAGATFTDPVTGAATDVGSQVDVHAPGAAAYRDFTLDFADDDFDLGRDFMGYVVDAHSGTSTVNYVAGRAGDGTGAYSTYGRVDPGTPLLRAYPGDPMQVHALVAPGSEQGHVFSLGGESWPIDRNIAGAQKVAAQGLGPWESIDAVVAGGAGGWASSATGATGDLFYGDLRRPFTVAGMWGLQRILAPSTCALKKLDGTTCVLPPPAPPTITSLSPASGPVGSTVSVLGTGLTATQFVAFTGAAAVAATVMSDGEVRAVVPAGAVTGPIKVTTRTGSALSTTSFTVTAPTGPTAPVVTGISPATGPPGTVVTVTGTGFTGATAVTFGNVAASAFTVASSTSLTATVPAGAVTGVVAVSTPSGSGAGPTFTLVAPVVPTISGFSPTSGPVGTAISISGSNLGGATSVTIGGASAVFSVNAAGVISTAVPTGAVSGPIKVSIPSGTATSAVSFTLTAPPAPPAPPPTLASFSPASGKVGSTVTLTGTNLAKTAIVSLSGVSAKFVVVSNTKVTFTVPKAATGIIALTTPTGTVRSTKKFTVK